MKKTLIKEITEKQIHQTLTVYGWVRTLRDQKHFAFMEINDGSKYSNLQVVLENTLENYSDLISTLSTGSSVAVTGILQLSPQGSKQKWELKASSVALLGHCPSDYPLQKKRHSFEFLRTIAHLRPRTNTQGAMLRVRNAIAFATHLFFQEQGFIYVQTPIITGSDCEGAGEQFTVTALDLAKPPKLPNGDIDFTKDFFARQAYLTVSGQLNLEALACALSKVYTFGPTFRAEKSNTSRHLAEFWMIEPEMVFADLKDNMACAEAYLKYILRYILSHCLEDLEFFDSFIEKGLLTRLKAVESTSFAHLTYTEAIEILKKSNHAFVFPVEWGMDLQSEHERYLAEEYCKKPLILTDYPKEIKSFYMRDNEDGKTVAAMDVLVPKIGEIIGGSQREERIEVLEKKIQSHHLDLKDYWWYLDLRKYGTAFHSGFGAGFERLILFTTGMENIRDVISFPRYPEHANF